MKFVTVQRRHSEKWFSKIVNVKSFSLSNCFSGAEVGVNELRWCIEKLRTNLQIDKEANKGRLRCHSNQWYEFEIVA